MTAGISLDRTVCADLSGRAKLRFSGPQALWFLDQLVTNKVDELPPGGGADALLLSPGGRSVSALRILHRSGSAADAPDALVDAPPGHASRLMDFFSMRVFATKVRISDVSEEFAILRVLGPEADRAVGKGLGTVLPGVNEHENRQFGGGGPEGLAVRVAMPAPGWDLWADRTSLDALLAGLKKAGVEPLDAGEYEAIRIGGGVPAFGIDFDERYLPQEAAFEKAVHFKKGCYLGQEAVAMAQRGRIKRRLRHLEFTGDGSTGKVLHEEAEAGVATSAAVFGGAWFGIATLRTDVPVGDLVHVVPEGADTPEPQAAVVKELPGTVYGPSVPSARELREKLQGR